MNGNEKQVYPPRGQMSADGKYYTHTNGSVHVLVEGKENGCNVCSMCSDFEGCRAACTNRTHCELAEGAHGPSEDDDGAVREACDMARDAIRACDLMSSMGTPLLCRGCPKLSDKSCPARLYLAKHGDPDAWEVPE